ncbi:MAG: winged helix-turn-helix transcriptional regulator [Rhizobiaceae bacterium]
MQVKPYLAAMLGRLYENQNCSAARALELIGERWSLLILRDAMFGNLTRFSQFQKSLGLATNILTKRLECFVADGLMERRQPAGEQAEYLLTQKGQELKPVVMALTAWGDKWVRPGPIDFCHAVDGELIELQTRRADDDGRVTIAEIVATLR